MSKNAVGAILFIAFGAIVALATNALSRGRKELNVSYEKYLEALKVVKPGRSPEQVSRLMGPPHTVQGKNPEADWYDELWVYDFQKLPDYPKGSPRESIWGCQIAIRDGKVAHIRTITWLE
jgi:hypothetical protein